MTLQTRIDLQPWPKHLELRAWQLEAEMVVNRGDWDDLLFEVTPGGGKTLFALRTAHRMLSSGAVDRIVVVCPSEYLRSQWAREAANVDIQLDYLFSNGQGHEAEDQHGVCITYQAVASAPYVHGYACHKPTLVIFDEIHHAGDSLSWGTALQEAFGPASYRLALTGTAFRSDNNRIPFVQYSHGKLLPDFSYTYGDALRDDINREIVFPTFEGKIEWLSRGEHITASFNDPLTADQARQRLRMALDPSGEWPRSVLREAWGCLQDVRGEDDSRAAMLVLAKDQDHARALAAILRQETGHEPLLAISEDSDSSMAIQRFKDSSEPVIIAVRMVSEGVDIPRLRVCVYATNYVTPLFFRQAAGRILRGPRSELAYMYMPADPLLMAFGSSMKQELLHALKEEEQELRETASDRADERELAGADLLGSQAIEHDVIFGDERISIDIVQDIRQRKIAAGIPASVPDVYFLQWERSRSTIPERPAPTKPTAVQQVKRDRKATIRGLLRTKIGYLARLTNQGGSNEELKRVYRDINHFLAASQGKLIDQCTEQDLLQRLERVNGLIEEAKRGNFRLA